MNRLFDFCAALDALHVRYGVLIGRDDAVMVTLVIPGQYLEVEFFTDETIEIERFLSQGVDAASDADLRELIQNLSS